jgi:hypothetical protein
LVPEIPAKTSADIRYKKFSDDSDGRVKRDATEAAALNRPNLVGEPYFAFCPKGGDPLVGEADEQKIRSFFAESNRISGIFTVCTKLPLIANRISIDEDENPII